MWKSSLDDATGKIFLSRNYNKHFYEDWIFYIVSANVLTTNENKSKSFNPLILNVMHI